MENQRKINFLIVVMVLGMHAFLFSAVIATRAESEFDSKQQALHFVDLGMGSNQVANNAPPKLQSQQSDEFKQAVKIPIRKVIPKKSLIKPAVVSRTQSQFKVSQPKDDESKLVPSIAKATSSISTPVNSSSSTSANTGGKSETTSANSTNAGGQSSGNLVVPKEYQGGFLTALKPPYPSDSKNEGEEGIVTLSVWVSADGKAQNVVIKKSSGYRRLDIAAKRAVLQHRFKPATRGGTPIAYGYNFKVKFELTN